MRSFFSELAVNDTVGSDTDDLYCTPDASWNFTDTCNYVQTADACLGGGYLEWTTFVFCCEDPVAKWFIVAGGVLFLVLLILMLSTSADEFFSPNVSTIVAHLKISENVAGVTFLAFGNGVTDVFTSVASVLSSPQPKADLALGELIGGTIFITLSVTAAIVITRPFKAAYWSTLRDLVFLLITASLTLSFFLFFDEIELWQPLTFLGIYVVYVIIVFTTEYFKRKKIVETREMSKRNSVIPSVLLNASEGAIRVGRMDGNIELPSNGKVDELRRGSAFKRLSIAVSTVLGTGHDNEMFVEDPENDTDDFVVMHNKVYHGEHLRSRAGTIRSITGQITRRGESFNSLYGTIAAQSENEPKGCFSEFLSFFAPEYGDEDTISFSRMKTYLLWPIVTLFKLTIPKAEAEWSKPLAIIQAILCPQVILFNTKLMFFVPFEGGPGLWAFVPVISVILIVFIVFATDMKKEPRFYEIVYALSGFAMSIFWIYCILAEVVDVVDMLGVVSGIPQAILGITLLAWANSVGDLVADISVARQGFPRMALAASIGGPLFNLLIGFGAPFTIAKLKGDTVPITLDGVNVIMITFLFISIIFTTINLIIFKANLKRIYGILLAVIYVSFLVFVILSVTGVLVWM